MTVHDAHVVIGTDRFHDDLAMLTDELGFRIETIRPADGPTTAVVSGHGVRLRLTACETPTPATIELIVDQPGDPVTLPGGTTFACVACDRPYEVPDGRSSLTITRVGDDSTVGRAGMRYRDLLPDRWGGRFIASHITIPNGGPVPDSVHFHKIRFQVIVVIAGWVRLVYEDQGEPFVARAGDVVLQPTEIRHRVLESSRGLEVIEIGCPAEHETILDWSLALPNGIGDDDRRWGGQAFVHHVAAEARWRPWQQAGWECRDSGVGAATAGLAGVRFARPITGVDASPDPAGASGEFVFRAVVAGAVDLAIVGRPRVRLTAGDAVTVPPGLRHAFGDPSPDCELLDVTLPAEPDWT